MCISFHLHPFLHKIATFCARKVPPALLDFPFHLFLPYDFIAIFRVFPHFSSVFFLSTLSLLPFTLPHHYTWSRTFPFEILSLNESALDRIPQALLVIRAPELVRSSGLMQIYSMALLFFLPRHRSSNRSKDFRRWCRRKNDFLAVCNTSRSRSVFICHCRIGFG